METSVVGCSQTNEVAIISEEGNLVTQLNLNNYYLMLIDNVTQHNQKRKLSVKVVSSDEGMSS